MPKKIVTFIVFVLAKQNRFVSALFNDPVIKSQLEQENQ